MSSLLPIHREAWNKWLDYERDFSYWAEMASKMKRCDGRYSILSSILTGGAVLTLTSNLVDGLALNPIVKVVVPSVFAISSTVFSHLSRHLGYAENAAKYQMLATLCGHQLRAWKEIRDACYSSPSRKPSPAAVQELRKRDDWIITTEGAHIADKKIAAGCERHARKQAELFKKTVLDRRNAQGASGHPQLAGG